jgi:hypothetical protein
LEGERKEAFLRKLENSLGLRLPKKEPKIQELLKIPPEPVNYWPRKPKFPQRKRGYDDKGHLPEESKLELVPDVSVLEESEDIFELLLRQTDASFRFFYPD